MKKGLRNILSDPLKSIFHMQEATELQSIEFITINKFVSYLWAHISEIVVWNLCSLFEVYSADFYPDSYFFNLIFFVFYICIWGSCKNPSFNFFTLRSKAWIFWCYFGLILRFFSFYTFFSNGSIKYAFQRLMARFLLGDLSFNFFILLKLLDFDLSFLSVSIILSILV